MLHVWPGVLVQACPSSLVLLRPSFLCPAGYPHRVSQLWSSQVLSPSFPLTLSLCICVLHSPVSAYRETIDAIGFESPKTSRVWQLELINGTEYIVNMGLLIWNLELDGSLPLLFSYLILPMAKQSGEEQADCSSACFWGGKGKVGWHVIHVPVSSSPVSVFLIKWSNVNMCNFFFFWLQDF